MGIHGWLLLDSAVGQHILSESYTPAFGLPFRDSDPTALSMSLAALVFALKQNADCVFPRPETTPGDRAAEWRQHARNPQWVDLTPNSSSVVAHVVGHTRLAFFQHQCCDILCVVASSPAVPPEAGAYLAEALCKRFVRLHGGGVPGGRTPAAMQKTFRPVLHAVLRSFARRFCCARVANALGALCRSPWVLLTYSPALTTAMTSPLPQPTPPAPRRLFPFACISWLHRQPPDPLPSALAIQGETDAENLVERYRGLRGASLLYFSLDEDPDISTPRNSPPAPDRGRPGPLHAAVHGRDNGSRKTSLPPSEISGTEAGTDDGRSEDDASMDRELCRVLADFVEQLEEPVLSQRISETLRRSSSTHSSLLALLHEFDWDASEGRFRVPPDGSRRSLLAHRLRDASSKSPHASNVGSTSSLAGRGSVSSSTTASAKNYRVRTFLQKYFYNPDEHTNVAALLDAIVTAAKLHQMCRPGQPAADFEELDIEYHIGTGSSSAQIKVLKQGDMYMVFPVMMPQCVTSPALLKPLLAKEITIAQHIFQLLYQQKVPTFMDVDP